MTADSDEGFLAASHGFGGHRVEGSGNFNRSSQSFEHWHSRRSSCAAQAEGSGALGVCCNDRYQSEFLYTCVPLIT